jgi:hypothetical protein
MPRADIMVGCFGEWNEEIGNLEELTKEPARERSARESSTVISTILAIRR